MYIIIPFSVLHIIRSLSNDDCDGNENGNIFARASRFFVHYLILYCCTTRTWRFLISRFTHVDARQKFFFPCKRTQHCKMVHVSYVRLHTLLRVVWGLLRKVWNWSNFWANFCSLITDTHACTCITLFGTFPFRHRTTMTRKCLISRFMENVNKGRRIFLSGPFST